MSVRSKSFWMWVLLLLVAATTAQATPALSARLIEERGVVGELDDLAVRLVLTNESDAPAYALTWQTPFYGISADLFEVRLNGEPVAYTGRLVKRAAPGPADFVRIEPGQSLEGLVELTSVYDLSRPGQYTITFRSLMRDFSKSAGTFVRSNEVGVWRDGDAGLASLFERQHLDDETPGRFVGPSFVACSTSQQNSITSALGQAQTYANNASAYLQAGTRGARYTTWFGTYKASRYNSARSHFSSIAGAIVGSRFTFHCDCFENYYAYVFPNQAYHMWLCNAFWSAPTTGTDSKAGTIIHETSHYNVVASTDDWAYGQTACRSLATSNPNRAVDNADSHEYFAENTPSQN